MILGKSFCVLEGFFSEFIEMVRQEMNTIGDKLIPNFYSFIIQLFALIVLIIIVLFVGYKPVKKILNKRAEFVMNNVQEAEKNNIESRDNLQKSENMILESRKKANDIVLQAEVAARKRDEEMLNETRLQIENMKKNAELDIQRSQKEALDNIHDEMVNVAILASEEILKREVNKNDNERFVKEFIEHND